MRDEWCVVDVDLFDLSRSTKKKPRPTGKFPTFETIGSSTLVPLPARIALQVVCMLM